MNEQDHFFERARRELFPKMKEAALSMVLLGEPDPKLCMEVGAAILFNKPIIALVRSGQTVPLALRTIANKIVEVSEPATDADKSAIAAAVKEVVESLKYRGGPAGGPSRNLLAVIDQMLELIPHDQLNLRVELGKQKESARYTAPEAIPARWQQTAAVLRFYLGADPAQFSHWQQQVHRIFTGENL